MRRLLPLLLLLGAAPSARGQLLYEARRGDAVVHLLGSIHVLHPDSAALGPAVDAAYAAAGVVAFELDLDKAGTDALGLFARGLLPEGKTLLALLPDSTARRLKPFLAGPLGATLPRMRPWLAAFLVGEAARGLSGYEAASGVDAQLFRRAKADGKPRRALETAAEQVALFADLPDAAQVRYLDRALREADAPAVPIGTLVRLWRAGDAAALDRLLRANDDPALLARMLDARNAAWLPRIEALAAGEAIPLVVVGAGHLVGAAGLVALLEGRGFTVRRVPAGD